MGSWDVFNPAGGLSYHCRAALNASQRWGPFRENVGSWLRGWQPPERHLVLVGPSGGYTLPITWLTTFEKLTILEPDPVARWLLRRKLTNQVRTNRSGRSPECAFIADDNLVTQPARLPELVARNAPCAILFSNILGQLGHLIGDATRGDTAAIKAAVRDVARHRSWASYHDRVSGAVAPNIPPTGLHAPRRLTEAELYPLYAHSPKTVTLVDHDTDELFPKDVAHSYFSWPLTAGYFHLIEAVRHVGS